MRAAHQTGGTHADRTLVRDAALVRISRTRRWTLAGAAALTAGLAALASALLPGKSFGAKTAHSAVQPTTSSPAVMPALPAPANAAQLGIGGTAGSSAPPQPTAPPAPAAAPQTAPSAPAAVSGGS